MTPKCVEIGSFMVFGDPWRPKDDFFTFSDIFRCHFGAHFEPLGVLNFIIPPVDLETPLSDRKFVERSLNHVERPFSKENP